MSLLDGGNGSGAFLRKGSGHTALRARALTKTYGRRMVVQGVDIDIETGEVVGLLGPNGAGKTTTFYMVVGLARPDSGQVFLGEEDITGLPMYMRARAGIGYLPQEASIFRKMTAEQNVLAILETMGLPPLQQRTRARALLEELGIASLGRQPAFILLDEPFAGVDPMARADLQRVISHLKQRGIGVLITDHNVRETLKIADRAYILREGEVFRSGAPAELASDEEVRKVYLGESFQL